MDKSFRLPARKTCAWHDCNHETTPRDEASIPFQGNTLLLSLCPSCLEHLKTQTPTDTLSFQSFSGNGYRYVESIYPTKEKHEQLQLQCG